jgi:hypothetical protein
MSLPNTITESVDFQGALHDLWGNFSVLAVSGNEAIIVASIVGSGKLAITTTNPAGTSRNATISNLLAWGDMPSIVLYGITKNQEIIWSGDRVVITMRLTNRIGVGVAGLTVAAWMNSTDMSASVQETGQGVYVLILNESWTSNAVGVHDLRLHAEWPGYDTLDLLLLGFVYIRPSPVMLLLIAGGALAAIALGIVYLRRKRGMGFTRPGRGPVKQVYHAPPDSDAERLRKEEEKRRKEEQKKRDRDFDAKELFGV